MQIKSNPEPYTVVWQPDDDAAQRSQMAIFAARAGERHRQDLSDYADLWQWSIDSRGAFWTELIDFADIDFVGDIEPALVDGDDLRTSRWFPDLRLNYAENLLRYRDAREALVFRGEDGAEVRLSYAELYAHTAKMAAALKQLGVGPGDRVAAIVPNIPQAVIAMLATSWLGGVWSSCSPDFGAQGILDRFGQIEPKVLIAVDGYRFKGRVIDIHDKVRAVIDQLPGCNQCIVVAWQDLGTVDGTQRWADLIDNDAPLPPFEPLPFDHPLYILYSSGTTGKPKCIVHGVGGTLLQHVKEHRLHTDLSRDDRLFFFTTCGWMMWNWLVSGLATGCTVVLYDGNPFHPSADALWKMADELGISVFGTSAKYLSAQEKAGVNVNGALGLKALRAVLSTGSPLAPTSYDYLHGAIKPGIQISSISGGTDIVSCFALGNPLLPVRRGQLQCRGLGMAVDVFDGEGHSVRNEPGEMVCTRSFPCMPVSFWNDPSGERYYASYFERFPGVWTHGDWTVLTDEGGLIIEGRSDAVLNPGGVRIGTAEIYRQVERLPQIKESVCIGQRWDDDVRVVLFVVLADGVELDAALQTAIKTTLREHASPRHVPAKILAVSDIPRTRSGKISELAVRDVIEGRQVKNTEALLNPEALEQYRDRVELTEA